MRYIGRVGAVLAVFFASSMARAEVPVGDYARKNDYDFVKISPTGEFLAVTKPIEGTTAIAFIDLKSQKLSGAVAFNRGDTINRFWWVAPERVVLEMAQSDGPLDRPRLYGELVAVNANGKGRTYLIGYRGGSNFVNDTRLAKEKRAFGWAFMVDTLVHDPANILALYWDWDHSERDPQLVRINVNDGARKTVAQVPGYEPVEVVTDEAGAPRFAISHDKDGECRFLSPGDKGWSMLPCGDDIGDLLGTVGTSVFYVANGENGTACLKEHAVGGAAPLPPVCNARVDVGNIELAFDGSRPIAVTFEDGKPHTVYPDAAHPDARLLMALEKGFKGQRIQVTSQTDDGSKIVVLVDGDRNPGDFYLVDRKTRKADYLLSRRSWIDPAKMQPVEPIRYQARDGMTIDGYLTARAGLATKAAPLVLLPHGGPHFIRDVWEWDPWTQVLADRGYAVLQVNYRGSGGYGEAHEKAGYRKWGTAMQDDLTDAVKWAVKQGIADPARVCIFGASYGGYAALMSATREPDLYRCAASLSGVYDLATQSKDSDIGRSLFGSKYLDRAVGTDAKELLDQSPVAHVAALKIPVLVAHGTADRRVPFSQAKELRVALQMNKKAFEWMEFEGEEHGLYKDENHAAFLAKLLEFLDRNIGAGAPAAKAGGP